MMGWQFCDRLNDLLEHNYYINVTLCTIKVSIKVDVAGRLNYMM